MDITIFLAKVIGWYLVITSLYVFFRRKNLHPLINAMVADSPLMLFMAIITLILGLLLVISHNVWVVAWPLIITITGWLILLSALLRLFFPDQAIRMAHWWSAHANGLMIMALIYLLIGLFLLYKGYYYLFTSF
ncbi:hypothetical protein B1207_03225 [Legionella quinlivanii]|uniref:Integral membrane protein (PIN domain superfamily) n=1 Tax=Legionella quinlivanii TaxID=45073 RepID=A0A364LMH6_9GAMM|nr:hypothetical protein [Legionella quinlivanii]RAP38014.1 hypothetical protein B1207_03225 [Legionella quinlivanii]